MTKKEFEIASYRLLNENEKILIFLRIPNSGNNRHFFFIENKRDFDDLVSNCNPSDSITVFKSFTELYNGIVTHDFIDKSLQFNFQEKSITEVVVLEDSYPEFKEKGCANWDSAESIDEFKEVLNENLDKHISIIIEPKFWDEENTYHLYVPNKYGISIPGKSY